MIVVHLEFDIAQYAPDRAAPNDTGPAICSLGLSLEDRKCLNSA